MDFISNWITIEDFKDLKPINIFHKERGEKPAETTEFQNYHIHFRKKFMLSNAENIKINISADDYYKLYVNGKFVCQGPAPAYPANYKYNSVALSDFLTVGENIIAAHIYYQGLINRVWVSGDNRCGLIADVFANGEYLFGTDETWLCSRAKEFSGKIYAYDTAFTENIDFRLIEKGWRELSFDDSAYSPAVCVSGEDYTFCDAPTPTVAVYDRAPEKVIDLGGGNWFIDFGKELIGRLYLEAKGNRGDKIRILCGEETVEGNPHLARSEMRCNCSYDEVHTLSGELDKLEYFDYKAFRYVNVIAPEGTVDEKSFRISVNHHPFRDIRRIKSDIPHLEDIWRLCRNTIKYASQEHIPDCPSRERGLYSGDFTITGPAHYYLTGDLEYYRKGLLDFADTASVCPGLMAVANSSLMQEIADYSLLFPLHMLNYYNITGDIETVRALYPTARGVVGHFRTFERGDGLIGDVRDKWNMVDWPDCDRDGYDAYIDRDTDGISCHNVINAYYIGARRTVNELAKILGKSDYDDTSAAEKAFYDAFYDEKTGLFCDSEEKTHSSLHSNVLPFFFGIAKEEMLPRLKEFMLEKQFACSPYVAYFMCKCLARIGAYEEELALLANESGRGWVNMIREGATTCFESWGADTKWNTSLCHPWSCAPIPIICEDLAGKFGIEVEKI